jgi:shikimate kinase
LHFEKGTSTKIMNKMLEIISRPDFDARLGAGELALTLIGMSNVGKSFWSTHLAEEADFNAIGCDDLIEAELGSVLQDAGFNGGITDMAKWMGQPYDPQFTANQHTYLDLETMTMRRTIERLTQSSLNGNTVVDTTGSVVHTGDKIAEELAKNSTVVYLEATPSMRQKMFELYIAEPKPVVWGDVYTQREDEMPSEALSRSYPELLARRSGLYQRMAHVAIPRETSLAIANANDFLEQVRGMLPAAY